VTANERLVSDGTILQS